MKSTPLLLSAVILTKNEALNLPSCLKTVSFCDEVLIIDDYSTDNTLKIARKAKARIYSRAMNNNFAKQRNFALTKASGEWILFIDADEQISTNLQKEIRTAITQETPFSGYLVRRVDYLWGREITHGEMSTFGAFGNGYILRLARKGSGLWRRNIHEEWNIKGNVGKLQHQLNHFPHQTVFEFLKDIGERAQLHAKALSHEGKKSSLLKIIFWPIGKLLYNFVYRLGFLDGTEGFVLAMIMSFHSFISWSYLWLIQK